MIIKYFFKVFLICFLLILPAGNLLAQETEEITETEEVAETEEIDKMEEIAEAEETTEAEETSEEEEEKNAVNLSLPVISLLSTVTFISLSQSAAPFFSLQPSDLNLITIGIGYERKIVDHFSIYGTGIFLFNAKHSYLLFMNLNFTGRYYLKKQFAGWYFGLGFNYIRIGTGISEYPNIAGFNLQTGYKFKLGRIYAEPYFNIFVLFGNGMQDMSILSTNKVGILPAPSFNIGILF